MFKYYWTDGKRRVVLAQNLLAPFLEEAAEVFRQQNYFYQYARLNLGYMARFGDWLQKNRIPIEHATKEDGCKYIARVIRHPHDRFRKRDVRSAVFRAISLIRKRYPPNVVQSPAQVETRRYVEHLRNNRNLAEGTIVFHRRILEEFLVLLSNSRSCVSTS